MTGWGRYKDSTMHNSSFKGAMAFALSLTFMASAVEAATHEIAIVHGGYFPAVTYAQAGDQVIFENQSDASHTVQASDGGWTSGSIAPNGTYSMTLDAETALSFTGNGENGSEVSGSISFDPAPIN